MDDKAYRADIRAHADALAKQNGGAPGAVTAVHAIAVTTFRVSTPLPP